MKHYSSALEKISQEVFQVKSLQEGQSIMKNFLNESKIKDSDKQSMIRNVEACKNLPALQRFLCNALLKFEGMSTNTK